MMVSVTCLGSEVGRCMVQITSCRKSSVKISRDFGSGSQVRETVIKDALRMYFEGRIE